MQVPKEIIEIIKRLKEEGLEGYLVGGCVRDILHKELAPSEAEGPHDFDIATNASPLKIQKIFKKSFLDNNFGTVTVFTGAKEKNLREVQITPYRKEEEYKDKRHPEKVIFVGDIGEDLKRRDFTINAMAIKQAKNQNSEIKSYEVIDLFGGKKDLKNKIIKAVGDPRERFSEDALRLMRAVRFSASLGFTIEKETEEAIKENSALLKQISSERVRDEFLKIIMTKRAKEGIEQLRKLNLLEQFLPEILEGYGVAQSKHHIYDCYEHSIRSLDYAARKNFGMHVRVAALLHDIAKPRAKEGEGEEATFYNHEVIGAKMARNILRRLKFKKKDVEKITLLVRYHLFYYNVGEVSESSVRRLLRKVGKENIEELLEVRMADRIGSGVPKAEPYKLRHLRYLIERVSRDPISVGMLKIDGNEVIEIMDASPGPIIGNVLQILLSEVINDPSLNKREVLEEKVRKIKNWEREQIKEEACRAEREIEELEMKRDKMTKEKYWVT